MINCCEGLISHFRNYKGAVVTNLQSLDKLRDFEFEMIRLFPSLRLHLQAKPYQAPHTWISQPPPESNAASSCSPDKKKPRERERNGYCVRGGVWPPGRRRTSSLPLSVVTAGVPPSQVASVYLLTTTAHHHYVTPIVAVGKELAGKIQGCRRLI